MRTIRKWRTIAVPPELWEKLAELREIENCPYHEIINQLLLGSSLKTYALDPPIPERHKRFKTIVERKKSRWQRHIRVYAKGVSYHNADCTPSKPCYRVSIITPDHRHSFIMRVSKSMGWLLIHDTAYVTTAQPDPELYREMVLEALRLVLKICKEEKCEGITYENCTCYLAQYIPLVKEPSKHGQQFEGDQQPPGVRA